MRLAGWGTALDRREVISSGGPTWQLMQHVIVGPQYGLSPLVRRLEQPNDLPDSRASMSTQPSADPRGIDTELARHRTSPIFSVQRLADHDEPPGCGAQVGDVPCRSGGQRVPYALLGRRAQSPRHEAAGSRAQVAVAAADGASAVGIGSVRAQNWLSKRLSNRRRHAGAPKLRRTDCSTPSPNGRRPRLVRLKTATPGQP